MTLTDSILREPRQHLSEDDLLDLADQVLAPTYARPRTLFIDGVGATVTDASGETYLDMTCGIAVTALGHRSLVVADAIREAVDRPVHHSNLYHTAPAIELAARLVELSFADSVFFANSGAEAVEAALKFARLVGGEDRREVLHFSGSFHGRTLGALAATDRPNHQDPFRPLAGGVDMAPWNSEEALESVTERTAAVILEPIQGEMGVREADPGWVQKLRARCDHVGALLIFDEIQCGLGRTGQLWAHSRLGVSPDMMTLAKPLAGGLPIGAVLMTRRVAEALSPGLHGTTFGGGPFVTRVALAVLNEIATPSFLMRVVELGDHLFGRLREFEELDIVAGLRGRGLMCGIQMSVPVKRVVDVAFEHGLLVVPSADDVIRVLPPLNTTEEVLDQCADKLGETFEAIQGEVS